MWAPVMLQPVRAPNGRLQQLLDPQVKSALTHLLTYLSFMLSAQRSDYESQEEYEAAVDHHCDELLEYCKAAEEVRHKMQRQSG